MSKEIEKNILGWIYYDPSLLEKVYLDKGLFELGKHRAIFKEFSRQFQEHLSIDLFIAAERIGGDGIIAYLDSLKDGLPKSSSENFENEVRKLKEKKLQRSFLQETEKQRKNFLKGLPIDLQESTRLLDKIQELKISRPEFRIFDTIEGQSINWLWKGRIPLGMITLLCGDPGVGKSYLTTWLAAKLSQGAPLPDDNQRREKISTVILAAEDSVSYAVRPRLDANNADCSKIYYFDGASFNIKEDISKFKSLREKDPTIKLVQLDTLTSYIGKVDYLKDPNVRDVLLPLVKFAEEQNIAILGVVHLNKKEDLSSIYRIGGSIAFTGVARSVLAISKDENDENRRFLLPLKVNYAKKPPALAFRIQDDLRLIFEDKPVDANVDEALSSRKREEASESNFVNEWLKEMLSDGPIESNTVLKKAREHDIPRSTLFNAKKRLGILSVMQGFGKNRTSEWKLP